MVDDLALVGTAEVEHCVVDDQRPLLGERSPIFSGRDGDRQHDARQAEEESEDVSRAAGADGRGCDAMNGRCSHRTPFEPGSRGDRATGSTPLGPDRHTVFLRGVRLIASSKFPWSWTDAWSWSRRDAASREGLKLYPISYGRAQALLGLVKARPRKRSRAARAGDDGEVKRLSLVQGAAYPSSEVEGFLSRAQELQQERDRYRRSLEALRAVLVEALDAYPDVP